MARYTFTCEHFDYNDYTGKEEKVASKHTTEFRADTLESMLENFEMFLRGSGFHFNGLLDIVDQDEEVVLTEKEEPVHPWTQTLREDCEWPFSTNETTESWNGVSPSVAMQWTVKELMKSPVVNTEDVVHRGKCEVCGLDKQMMTLHKCFEQKCPVHAES